MVFDQERKRESKAQGWVRYAVCRTLSAMIDIEMDYDAKVTFRQKSRQANLKMNHLLLTHSGNRQDRDYLPNRLIYGNCSPQDACPCSMHVNDESKGHPACDRSIQTLV